MPLLRPHVNTYWVSPGRLLAGEYPGDPDDAVARRKLGAYLDAGVTGFLDLTAADELTPYEPLLLEVAAKRKLVVQYVRLPIRDASVPSVHTMIDILHRIDNWLSAGVCVYVHCWGGVGRTGTVVGCYLVAQGHTGPAALDQLAAHWATVGAAKRARHPASPETPDQADFVRLWDPTPTP